MKIRTANGTTRYECDTNEEWRHERAKSVGASAVGSILGVNPFESPRKLAVKMRNELKGIFDYSQSTAMRRGHLYEGGVAQYYYEETGHQIIQSSAIEYIVRRDDFPFLHASPDRIFWIDNDGPRHGKISEDNKGVLECKTTSKSFKTIHPYWLYQLQTIMGVTGYHQGALCWDVLTKKEGFGYRNFRFAGDEFFNALLEVCDDFLHRVVIRGKDPRDPKSLAKDFPALFNIDWNSLTISDKPVKPSSVPIAHKVILSTANPSASNNPFILHEEEEAEAPFQPSDTLSWFSQIINRIKG